jgi:RNA polymerase sigma-70 factor, ECF subfamily
MRSPDVTNRPLAELVSVPLSSPPSPTLPASQTLATSDATLVRRVLAGDRDAFTHLVDRHHERCLRVAVQLLGSPDDAEDVVQEALLRAYRHLGSYRERDRFSAWLARIVVNQCRTRVAHEARWAPLEQLPVSAEACDAAVEASLDADTQRQLVSAALAQLPFDQREAVVLRFTEARSYDEMASITGVGVSALKMRVQRACARLRSLLSEPFDQDLR